MQVNRTVQVSALHFFSQVAKQVKEDYELQTLKKIELKDVKEGLIYNKVIQGDYETTGRVQARLTVFERPTHLRLEFSNEMGRNIMEYQIRIINDDSCEVSYIETYEGNSLMKKMKYAMVSIFGGRKTKKRMKALLESLETKIKKTY